MIKYLVTYEDEIIADNLEDAYKRLLIVLADVNSDVKYNDVTIYGHENTLSVATQAFQFKEIKDD